MKAADLAATMSENDLQEAVIEAAHALGYICAHFRPARTEKGWRTAVSADGKGFPDLVAAGRGRVIFAELKGRRGALSPDQQKWRDQLLASNVEWHMWRPADWPEPIMSVLRG